MLQAQLVTAHHGRQRRRQLVHHFDVFFIAVATRQNHGQIAQQFFQLKRMEIELQFARIDFGKIQNVVQQAQQRRGGGLRLAGVIQLACVQLGLAHQLQHPQHGVHRRADFVAHIGQKLALGHAGGFGHLTRLAQAGFKFQATADVLRDAR